MFCAARADCAAEKSGQGWSEDLSALVSKNKQSWRRREKKVQQASFWSTSNLMEAY